jgi:hypothetical protein
LEAASGTVKAQALSTLEQLFEEYRSEVKEYQQLKKTSKKLQEKKRTMREKIVTVKQRRSEVHEQLYVEEVKYHLSEQDRIEVEGLQSFVTDLEEVVKETNKKHRPNTCEGPANLEVFLQNVNSIQAFLASLGGTKKHLLATEKLVESVPDPSLRS